MSNQIIFKIPICHRLPDRTFNICGYYFSVCSRCTGLYMGAISFYTCSLFLFVEYTILIILFALIITFPLILDGLTQFLGFRESNNGLRFITGFVAGVGIALLVSFFKILII